MTGIHHAIGAVILFVSLAAGAAPAPTAKECKLGFILSGKTYEPFKDITPNQWNNMLPKLWQDKGGHFLSRIKEDARGGAAAIHTPADLESMVFGGELAKTDRTDRWLIVRQYDKLYSVVFDINTKSKKCELVTFLVQSLQDTSPPRQDAATPK